MDAEGRRQEDWGVTTVLGAGDSSAVLPIEHLAPGAKRYYRMTAAARFSNPTHRASVASAGSNRVQVTRPPVPPIFPFLDVEMDGDAVLLTWVPPGDDGGARVTSYQLQRSKVAQEETPAEDNANWTNLSAPSTRTLRITGLTAEDTWHYRLRARNSAGWSGWNYARIKIPAAVEGGLPGAPALTARVSGTAVNLSWTEPSNMEYSVNSTDKGCPHTSELR